MNKVKLLLVVLAVGVASSLFAQKTISKIAIQTSASIEKSRDIVEQALAVEKGVKSFEFKKGSSLLMVSFRTDKTSPEAIRKVISESGFDADNVKADPKAAKFLPKECKPKSSCSCGTKPKTSSCCGSKK
jgi:septal ring-binding cell division protein DamX